MSAQHSIPVRVRSVEITMTLIFPLKVETAIQKLCEAKLKYFVMGRYRFPPSQRLYAAMHSTRNQAANPVEGIRPSLLYRKIHIPSMHL